MASFSGRIKSTATGNNWTFILDNYYYWAVVCLSPTKSSLFLLFLLRANWTACCLFPSEDVGSSSRPLPTVAINCCRYHNYTHLAVQRRCSANSTRSTLFRCPCPNGIVTTAYNEHSWHLHHSHEVVITMHMSLSLFGRPPPFRPLHSPTLCSWWRVRRPQHNPRHAFFCASFPASCTIIVSVTRELSLLVTFYLFIVFVASFCPAHNNIQTATMVEVFLNKSKN